MSEKTIIDVEAPFEWIRIAFSAHETVDFASWVGVLVGFGIEYERIGDLR